MAAKRKAARKAKPRRTTDTYSLAVVEAICDVIATSERGLQEVCDSRQEWPTSRTFYRWLDDPSERFEPARRLYARAKELQGEFMASRILAIADDGQNDTYIDADGKERVNHDHINRSRLRVDARKFLAAKLAPRIYGDRVQHDVRTPEGVTVAVDLTAKLDELAAKVAGDK